MVITQPKTTEAFYNHLLQTVSAGVLVLDDNGIVTSANSAAGRILGWDSEQLIGRTWADLGATEQNLAECLPHQTTLRQPDGRSVTVNLAITPVSDHITSTTMVSFTHWQEIEQLNEALLQIQRLAGIGLLTASVAHELNTPLSIIAATCSNLLHEIEENSLGMEQLMRYVQMIEQSAWRSARIVEVLRNYSYAAEMQTAVTDLNMIIEDALVLVQHQFRGEYNIQLVKQVDESLKTIVLDHNRLTQVLLNLLINARDAMSTRGGTVEIRSWRIADNRDVPSRNGNGAPQEAYAFSVSDTGSGIEPALLERIFEPFFSTKPLGKGAGLGLFISRQIVEQHNGRIWAENNELGGATFTVVLPRNL
ncbi:two-component system sensor histidine kinase NtrB [Candidatus Leptofilum sp.]|uniref:two-component system sensor histidine kinase NtrB n=1 Tax=Candidatus Leptofilum sp. TaxID=3241576 RepID=UPI003B59C6A8